jgi:enoyl-CoA hydratase/carnithine racemase
LTLDWLPVRVTKTKRSRCEGGLVAADEQHLLCDVTDGVGTITFNRPDHLNAMSHRMSLELIEALDALDEDPSVRAVILTGRGRAFCAGADLSSGSSAFAPGGATAGSRPDGPGRDWGGVLVLRLFEMNTPVIAAVNGPAVGVGATLTLPCDVRLASTAARFGFVFARRGIVTDGCASWFLPRVVGPARALRWCLTGEVFEASEALDGGLVAALHEPEDLLAAATALARELAATTSAVSVALTRRLIWQGLVADHPIQSHAYETEALAAIASGPEAREGVLSFLEKRPPRFPGTVPGSLPAGWPPWEEPAYPGSTTPQ